MKKLVFLGLIFSIIFNYTMEQPTNLQRQSPYGQLYGQQLPPYQNHGPAWNHTAQTTQEADAYLLYGDINDQDSSGNTLLHYALKHRTPTLAWYLLTKPGIKVTLENFENRPPHYYASYGNYEHILFEIKRLEKNPLNIPGDERLRLYWYDAVFRISLIANSENPLKLTEKLIRILITQDSKGNTALHHFIEHSFETAEQLVDYIFQNKKYCDNTIILGLSIPDYKGITPLSKACDYCPAHSSFIQKLIDCLSDKKLAEDILSTVSNSCNDENIPNNSAEITYDEQLVIKWLNALSILSSSVVVKENQKIFQKSFNKNSLDTLVGILNTADSQGNNALNYFIEYYQPHARRLLDAQIAYQLDDTETNIVDLADYLNLSSSNAKVTPFRKALYCARSNNFDYSFINKLLKHLLDTEIITELNAHTKDALLEDIWKIMAQNAPGFLLDFCKQVDALPLTQQAKRTYFAQAFKYATIYSIDFCVQVFDFFQKYGGEVNDPIDGRPALIHALLERPSGDCFFIFMTLKQRLNANINQPEYTGLTPLMIALFYNKLIEAEQICTLGADLNYQFFHQGQQRWLSACDLVLDLKSPQGLEILMNYGLDTSNFGSKKMQAIEQLLINKQRTEADSYFI